MKRYNNDEQFIEQFKEKDFSAQSTRKDQILTNLLTHLEDKKELPIMKKRKPIALIAATVSIILVFSLMAYGQNVLEYIKTVMLGEHAEYAQLTDEYSEQLRRTIPDSLTGQIFDEDGNALDAFPEGGPEATTLYNADGEVVELRFDGDSFLLLTPEAASEFDRAHQESYESIVTEFPDIADANAYFTYDYRMPSYLPDGYRFDHAEIYLENGMPQENTKYMTVVFSDANNQITFMLRYMDEETAFGAGLTPDHQELTIHNTPALLDGNMLDIEIDGVMHTFFGNSDVDSGELIKIAESLF